MSRIKGGPGFGDALTGELGGGGRFSGGGAFSGGGEADAGAWAAVPGAGAAVPGAGAAAGLAMSPVKLPFHAWKDCSFACVHFS